MKRYIMILIVCIFILFDINSVKAETSDNGIITITPVKGAENAILLNVYIKKQEISYLSFYLNYDKDIFQSVSKDHIYIPDIIKDNADISWEYTYSDNINKLVMSEESGTATAIPNDGLICTIRLELKENINNISDITINNIEIVNKDVEDVNCGNIVISLRNVLDSNNLPDTNASFIPYKYILISICSLLCICICCRSLRKNLNK